MNRAAGVAMALVLQPQSVFSGVEMTFWQLSDRYNCTFELISAALAWLGSLEESGLLV